MITTKEAMSLRISNGLSAVVHGIFYDDKVKVHRIPVTISKGEERKESANYYIHSSEEVFSQEAALSLATENFLGKANYYIVKPTSNTAQNTEATNGNSEKSVEESKQKTSSESEGTVSKKKSGSSKKSSVVEKSKEEVEDSASSEEMEEVESPFKKLLEEDKKETPKPKNTLYSRSEERHVDILTSFLNQINGGETWKQNPNITQFSISLVGKEFIDAQGAIVPEFAATCRKFFGIATSGL